MEFKHGIVWNTKTTQYDIKHDITYSTGTFNSVKYIDQLKEGCSEKVKEDRCEPVIIKRKTFVEIKAFILEKWKGKKGPNKRNQNNDGFYEATIKNKKKVYSLEEMEKKPYIGAANNDYWLYPCYHDVHNSNTLEWWLIYYEN